MVNYKYLNLKVGNCRGTGGVDWGSYLERDTVPCVLPGQSSGQFD